MHIMSHLMKSFTHCHRRCGSLLYPFCICILFSILLFYSILFFYSPPVDVVRANLGITTGDVQQHSPDYNAITIASMKEAYMSSRRLLQAHHDDDGTKNAGNTRNYLKGKNKKKNKKLEPKNKEKFYFFYKNQALPRS